MDFTRIRIQASAVLLVVAFAGGPGIAASVRPATVSNADALDHIHIGNFGVVNNRFYRGSQPKGHDYVDLAALGVKTVIDLQQDGPSDEAGIVQRAGMQFFRIPMDTSDPPTRSQIATFFKIVDDPASQPVYLHCAGGRHRTGTMVAIYRMTDDGWTAVQAYDEMKRYHFEGLFGHPALKNFVFAYKPQAASQQGVVTSPFEPIE